MRSKRAFLIFAGFVFLVTGAAKIYFIFEPSRALDTLDPVFGFPFRSLAIGVGIVEIVVSTFCFFGPSLRMSLGLAAWLCTNLLLYRALLVVFDWRLPCHCLGSLTGRLPISPQGADALTGWLLACLTTGSYALLWWRATLQENSQVCITRRCIKPTRQT
jgi:hypothetical protein